MDFFPLIPFLSYCAFGVLKASYRKEAKTKSGSFWTKSCGESLEPSLPHVVCSAQNYNFFDVAPRTYGCEEKKGRSKFSRLLIS